MTLCRETPPGDLKGITGTVGEEGSRWGDNLETISSEPNSPTREEEMVDREPVFDQEVGPICVPREEQGLESITTVLTLPSTERIVLPTLPSIIGDKLT